MDNGKMMLDIAHLIDRKCVERYQNKFATTSALMRECQMQLSGPWPPYHFVHRLTRPLHAPLAADSCRRSWRPRLLCWSLRPLSRRKIAVRSML